MKLAKNQKVFLSYAWTGEDKEIITNRMSGIIDSLTTHGLGFYCNYLDPATKEFTQPGQSIKHALERLNECDILLAIVSSERRSQGQLMEIGAAIYANKPVITALHKSAVGSGYLDDSELVDASFVWENEADLLKKLEEIL